MQQKQRFESARLSAAMMTDHARVPVFALFGCQSDVVTQVATAPALVRGRALHLLDHDVSEHPVALQLGGSDPDELAEAAKLGAEAGYDEINLNRRSSDRVQSEVFGAILMQSPELVADCMAAMAQAVDVEVTVKCRIGVDDQNPQDVLPEFLEKTRVAGVNRHHSCPQSLAQRLSPRENRDIPPLDYELVHQMKASFPDIYLDQRGIATPEDAQAQLARGLDGGMIGRAAYHQPADVLAPQIRAFALVRSTRSAWCKTCSLISSARCNRGHGYIDQPPHAGPAGAPARGNGVVISPKVLAAKGPGLSWLRRRSIS